MMSVVLSRASTERVMVSRSSFEIQKSVLFALLMRELKTRFGRYRLGYAWALLEPAAHVIVLTAIFSFVFKRTIPSIDFPVFFIIGIVPFLMFSNMVTQGMNAISANLGLFGYRQVKGVDALLVRMALEGLIHFATLIVLMLCAAWVGYRVELNDPLRLLAALSLLYVCSLGCAFIFCVVATRYEEMKKFIPMVFRPMYFISGIFFPLSVVPPDFRVYLLWNPVLHAIELARDACFKSFETVGGSWQYLSMVSLCLLCFGFALFRQNALRLLMR